MNESRKNNDDNNYANTIFEWFACCVTRKNRSTSFFNFLPEFFCLSDESVFFSSSVVRVGTFQRFFTQKRSKMDHFEFRPFLLFMTVCLRHVCAYF